MDEIRGRFPMPYDLFVIIVPGWVSEGLRGFFSLCILYCARVNRGKGFIRDKTSNLQC